MITILSFSGREDGNSIRVANVVAEAWSLVTTFARTTIGLAVLQSSTPSETDIR